MVGNQIDIVSEQRLDSGFLHAGHRLRLTFPEVAVVHQDHIGTGRYRCVQQRLRSRNTGDEPLNLLSPFNLQSVGTVVLKVLRRQPAFEGLQNIPSRNH